MQGAGGQHHAGRMGKVACVRKHFNRQTVSVDPKLEDRKGAGGEWAPGSGAEWTLGLGDMWTISALEAWAPNPGP
eukprot:355452-Chlamydomonas_euryale.AAC.3